MGALSQSQNRPLHTHFPRLNRKECNNSMTHIVSSMKHIIAFILKYMALSPGWCFPISIIIWGSSFMGSFHFTLRYSGHLQKSEKGIDLPSTRQNYPCFLLALCPMPWRTWIPMITWPSKSLLSLYDICLLAFDNSLSTFSQILKYAYRLQLLFVTPSCACLSETSQSVPCMRLVLKILLFFLLWI